MRLEFSIYRYNPDVDDAPRMQGLHPWKRKKVAT